MSKEDTNTIPEDAEQKEEKIDSSQKDSEQDKSVSENELERITKERDEYLDGWKRARADLANYKKDELARLEHVAKFASEDIIVDLITVLDSFELALVSMEKDNPAEKGIYLIKTKLEDVLKKRGLKKINVEAGQKFDPVYHEAVDIIEGNGEEGTIAEEVESGYQLHNKVVRATRVKVFK